MKVIMGLLLIIMTALLLSVLVTAATEEAYAQLGYSPAAQNILDAVNQNVKG
jgi:hypothetical protein